MKRTVKNLLDIARGQIGYCEKASNSNLDSFSGNAGSNNYTKYARDLANAGYYQASKQGYEWCDMFVDWCFLQLCDKDPVKAQQMIFQTGPYGAGCECSANYYKNFNRLFYSNPQPGDQIFFGDYDHTGIVEAVENGYIITIEGNAGNMVKRLRYSLNDSWVTAFGRPEFEAADAEDNNSTNVEPPKPVTPPSNSNASVAKIHVVTAGESWWSIADDEMGDGNRMYELAEFNNASITQTLYVGNKIKIPGEGGSISNNDSVNTEARTHTVTAGESWWSIAEDEMGDGSKMHELAAFNNSSITKMLYVGNVLKIPGTSSGTSSGSSSVVRTHTVTAGESWWSIAEDEMGDGSKMHELAKFNGCTVNKMLYVGNVVKIPN